VAQRSGKKKASPGSFGGPLRRAHTRRVAVAGLVGLLLLGVVAYRCYRVHLRPDPRLASLEESHWVTLRPTVPRGKIYDRWGSCLATNREVPSLWADPSAIKHPEAVARALHERLNMPEDFLLKRLTKRRKNGDPMKFVWIKRRLSPEEVAAIGDPTEIAPKGLELTQERIRYYPENKLAAYVLGFVDSEGKGRTGMELRYDRFLRGEPGLQRVRADAFRNVIDLSEGEHEPATGGNHVYLTIDKALQHVLERELEAGLERVKGEWAMGVLMDPNTGAILALGAVPSYDLNQYGKVELSRLRNRPVVDRFEPGSAFKIVTAAAAVETGLVTPDTMIDCENGRYNPFKRRYISDVHKLGVVPFSQAFAESSNIAMVKLAQALGEEQLSQWIVSFGFGRTTCPDYEYESPGLFRANVKDWSDYSITALPIGQEVAVTLLQLARAYCAIANGGYLVEPYCVERVVSRRGETVYEHKAKRTERILSAQTAETMKDLCHQVITHGTGTAANIPRYRVAGKTGTAQIAKDNGQGYYEDKYNAVFAGFAPVGNPAVCCVIVVHAPDYKNKLHYGSKAAAPVFRAVVEEALIAMRCPEDPVVGPVKTAAAELHDADTVVDHLDFEILEPPLEDLTGLELLADGTDPNPGARRFPDLRGLTKREALERLAELGVDWELEGAGWVVAQQPAPGTLLDGATRCRLIFGNKRGKKQNET